MRLSLAAAVPLLALGPCVPALAAGPVNPQTLTTIAFGSCAQEDKAQPIWGSIVAQRPDLFLFIGDNVYADQPDPVTSPGQIAKAYRDLGAKPGFQKLRVACPVIATWDDHDYGQNDAGKEFRLKKPAQLLMLSFFKEPANSPRWTRDGVYGAWVFGPAGKRVQVLMLDTRYFRDPITRDPAWRPGGPVGPYKPKTLEDRSTLLGDEQWAWLGEQLRKPADVRIVASSIQVVAGEHGWEGCCNFPAEQQRLYDLIGKTGAGGVVFISGDRHLIEMSKRSDASTPYPMWDFTSSGFNWEPGEVNEANRYRQGPVLRQPNFGVIRIDWSGNPRVTLEGRGGDGAVLMSQEVELASLQTSAPQTSAP
ncbi:MAG: alkaline phosphatase D family protein [Planctomycetota bacterium]